MKYPYIGKAPVNDSKDCKEFDVCVFHKPESGTILEGNSYHPKGHYSNDWCEQGVFKNITAEYLANTYGEVKSKEHAEFIVKLAENHGYTLTGAVDKSNARTFVIDGESKMLFFMRGSNSFDGSTVKQITIPLPPECDSEDEWPKAGDEVVIDDDVGIVKLPADAQDYYIVEVNGLYKQCRFGELSKPKTPEQELCDEVNDCINDFQCQYMEREDIDYDKLAEYILSRFNITKKGEGDE